MKTHRRTIGRSALLATLLFTAAATSQAAVLLDENFNSGTPGDPITAPWTPFGTGTSTYNDAIAITGNSARMVNTTAGGPDQYFLGRNLSQAFDLTSSGTLTFAFSVYIPTSTWQVTIRLTDDPGNSVLTANFLDDSRVLFPTGATTGQFVGFADATWYDVSFTLNAATDTFDMSVKNHATGIDLEPTKTGLALPTGGATQITRFSAFVVSGSGNNQTAYLDNIVVGAVPEPSTVAMMAFGLAGLVALRHFRRTKGRPL